MLAKRVNVEGRPFNFENCFTMDMNGIGGGLALFCSSEVNVEIKSFSSHNIDAIVYNESGKVWRCIGIYGHQETKQKHHTWTLLERLAGIFFYPWCCSGDFNEVLHLPEKSWAMTKI